MGYKVIYVHQTPETQTDFTANVIAMKDAGVKLLFLDQLPEIYTVGDPQGSCPAVVPSSGDSGGGELQQCAGHQLRWCRQRRRRSRQPECVVLPGTGQLCDSCGRHLQQVGEDRLTRLQGRHFLLLWLAVGRAVHRCAEKCRHDPTRGSLLEGPLEDHQLQWRQHRDTGEPCGQDGQQLLSAGGDRQW